MSTMACHHLLSTTEVQIQFDGIGSPKRRSKKTQDDENEFLTGNTSSTRSSIVMEEARESQLVPTTNGAVAEITAQLDSDSRRKR